MLFETSPLSRCQRYMFDVSISWLTFADQAFKPQYFHGSLLIAAQWYITKRISCLMLLIVYAKGIKYHNEAQFHDENTHPGSLYPDKCKQQSSPAWKSLPSNPSTTVPPHDTEAKWHLWPDAHLGRRRESGWHPSTSGSVPAAVVHRWLTARTRRVCVWALDLALMWSSLTDLLYVGRTWSEVPGVEFIRRDRQRGPSPRHNHFATEVRLYENK